MNARARKIEAELIHFFAEVVGVEVYVLNAFPYVSALDRGFHTQDNGRRTIRQENVERFSLSELAERIERI